MPVIKPVYSSVQAVTISLASLASSSSLTAGQESGVIDNSTNRFIDAILSGKITVGSSPTSGTNIIVNVFALLDPSGTYPDVMDGSDSAETITSAGVGRGFLRRAVILDVDSTTSDREYPFSGISIADLFRGVMPQKWGVFVTHNTGVNLNATGGNHVINYQGVHYESVE